MFLFSVVENFLLSMMYVRILEETRTEINFSSETNRICVAIWCVFSAASAVVFQFTQVQVTICAAGTLILAKLAPKIAKRWQRRLFRRQILPYVNTVCLRLRVGEGLEMALREANSQQNRILKPIFQTISERSRLPHGENKDKESEMNILEHGIRVATENSHGARRILEALRYRLSVEAQFQRKLRSISAQVRAQMFISTLIYLSSVAFVHQRYGAGQYLSVILVSGFLTVFGMLALRHLLGRFTWKV